MQVLRPQTEAVARAAEDLIAAKMNALTASSTIEWALTADPDADKATVLAIREALTDAGVTGERFCAVAPNIATRLLSVPGFVEADKRGSTDAIDQAVIGTVYGITFVESTAITTATAVAYGRDAFAFATMAPVNPDANVDSSSAVDSGVALRYLRAFDASKLASLSVVSTFAGCSTILDAAAVVRAIKVDTAAA